MKKLKKSRKCCQKLNSRTMERDSISYTCRKNARILSSKQIRNGNCLNVEEYLRSTLSSVEDKVVFTLPSFPFKVPNPLKVAHRNLDAGELLCLKRLHFIDTIVEEILDIPALFPVISDGKIYSDICEIDPSEYEKFSEDARDSIAKMGLTKELLYVDMLDDVIGDRIDQYNDLLTKVKLDLEKWWNENKFTSRVQYLIANMSANINTNAEDYSFARCLSADNYVSCKEKYDSFLKLKAEQKAFTFMSKLVTLRLMDAVLLRYPGCIRTTVHPKSGQFGIHLVNSRTHTFPWQGTTLRKDGNKFRVVSSLEAWNAAHYEVRDYETNNILYYSVEEPGNDSAL